MDNQEYRKDGFYTVIISDNNETLFESVVSLKGKCYRMIPTSNRRVKLEQILPNVIREVLCDSYKPF